MKSRKTHGFTLVEMMAVVAIIAILALMAVPSYLDRVVKAQIDASLPLADIAKKPIAAIWAATHAMPADNASAGIPAAEKIVSNYVSSVAVDNGVINITFGNRAHKVIAGKVLSIRPAVVGDEPVVPVVWICGRAEAPDKTTLVGTDRTDIDNTYLPLECRSLKP
jgi:type IV pilus assembly protein PilA